jgi:hypothetical protein
MTTKRMITRSLYNMLTTNQIQGNVGQEYQNQNRPMTRSQTKAILTNMAPDIDFDAASRAWLANKRSIGNGCYEYVKIRSSKNVQLTL